MIVQNVDFRSGLFLFLVLFDIWTGAEAAEPAHECRLGTGLIHSAN
jgi:hypothetical protein